MMRSATTITIVPHCGVPTLVSLVCHPHICFSLGLLDASSNISWNINLKLVLVGADLLVYSVGQNKDVMAAQGNVLFGQLEFTPGIIPCRLFIFLADSNL